MADSQVCLQRIEDGLRFASETSPNREECFLCHRMIQQDPDTGWWFIEDESGWVPTHKSDFTNAYETRQGWICGTDCFDEHALSAVEMEGVA